MRAVTTTRQLLHKARPWTRTFATTVARGSAHFSPLHPPAPVTPLGLPTSPLPSPIPAIPSTPLDRAKLHKLCSLAALDPPPEGSAEETTLLAELGELVGLMDLVGSVQLEGDVGDLLSAGVGEFVIGSGETKDRDPLPEGQEQGRELLTYATRRVGDFYGFRVESKEDA